VLVETPACQIEQKEIILFREYIPADIKNTVAPPNGRTQTGFEQVVRGN
jgi:hypothetical protein